MQLPRRPIMRFAAGAAALPIVSFVAIAEDFPSRPITWVAPFPAGGPVTEPISRVLGQPIVIENVSGAAGSIGVGRVARAPPDGYTLIQGIGARMSSTARSTGSLTTCSTISHRSLT
jgi:tripartite-type tricarboxylate transporter receptor subunit TctC